MRIVLAIVAIFALGALSPAVSAKSEGLTLTLKKEVSLDGRFVTVAGVANLGGDAALIELASKVMLGRVPENAKAREITSGFVLERLQAMGVNRADVTLGGSQTVTVYNSTYVVIAAEKADEKPIEKTAQPAAGPAVPAPAPAKPAVPEAAADGRAGDVVELAIRDIRDMVAEDLKLKADDVLVEEVSRNPALRRLPAGVQRLKDVFAADAGAVLGQRIFKLVVTIGEETFSDLVLKVNVLRYDTVVIANRKIAQGEAIRSGDVRLERKTFDTRSKNYFTSIDSAVGNAPKSSIQPDQILQPADLVPAVLVKRGEAVTIVAGAASCSGEALEDGALGATIRVRRFCVTDKDAKNGGAAKKDSVVLMGRVLGNGSVEVGR